MIRRYIIGAYSELYADLLAYIRDNWIQSFHAPEGTLKHRFIDPASNYRGSGTDNHPETGPSTTNPGFMNRNGLAAAMIRDLEC